MNNKKPIIANLENAQISVGLSYKMNMYRINCDIEKQMPREEFFKIVEDDAIQMIKSSANVMRILSEKSDDKN